jgi:diaminopimelate epimerase
MANEQMTDSFFKYQALGNDMVVIDPAHCSLPLTPHVIQSICNRHFGPGADGICYGPLPGRSAPFTMRFFNPDGTEAEKSGNGLRIFVRYLWDAGYAANSQFTIEIHGSVVTATIHDDQAGVIGLEMGQLSFLSGDIPMTGPAREVVNEMLVLGNKRFEITAVNIGNPHCVIFSESPLASLVQEIGPEIETDTRFPNRTNVQFAQVIDQHTLKVEIWERGAGYTLASGTSASAVAGAAVRTNRCISPVTVEMQGGTAHVEVSPERFVRLTGAVAEVYRGVFAPDWLKVISQA